MKLWIITTLMLMGRPYDPHRVHTSGHPRRDAPTVMQGCPNGFDILVTNSQIGFSFTDKDAFDVSDSKYAGAITEA